MKTTDLRIGIVTMLAFFLACMGSFVFANGIPTGDPVLEIDNQSYNGTYDPGVGHLLTNDITELLCEKVAVDFIGVEVDASSGQGQVLLAIYENGSLLTHSGYLTVQGGVDELVGFNPMSNLEIHASSIYTLGVMYSSPAPIYFKTSNTPFQLGPLGYNVATSTVDINSTFPVLPTSLSGGNSQNFNVGFRIQGTLLSTHTKSSVSVSACEEYIWPENGQLYDSSGVYSVTYQNVLGCDSVVMLDLNVSYPVVDILSVQSCGPYYWEESGELYTNSGTYYMTKFIDDQPCDVLFQLNLTINPEITITQSETVCGAYTWPTNGITYTLSGTFMSLFTNASGCDSIVTLNLTINNSYEYIEDEIACESYTWGVNGMTYTTTGVYTENFTSVNGCDSVHILNLTINSASFGTDVIDACDAYTWIDGNTYTTSNNTATHTLTNAVGCDSVVTLDLSMYYTQSAVESIVSCGPFTWIDGNTYTSSINGPTHTLTTSQGCNFIKTLDLTVLNPSAGEDVVASCLPFTWIDGNTYAASNNSATYILTNAEGCDSIVTLNLTIDEVNTNVDLNGNVLTALASSAQYQWMECANDMVEIPGATQATFTAAANGDYAVRITEGQCTAVSECKTVAVVNTEELKTKPFSLYPNPSNGQFQISFDEELQFIEFMDMSGRILNVPTDVNAALIDATALSPGKYLVRITTIYNETHIATAIIE